MGERNVAQQFCSRNLRDREHLEDPGVDLRVILKWIFMNVERGMDWIDLAQGRNRWRAFINTVIKLHVPENAGKSFTS
jgi:hypothetical protein